MKLSRCILCLCALGLLACRSDERKLERDLEARDPAVRAAAARRLAKTEPKKAPPVLMRLLDDRDPRVRVEAASALGRLRVKSASKALGALVRDTDPRVRLAAIRALARLGRELAEDYLLDAVQDPQRSVRRAARNTLQDLGVPRPVQERRRVARLVAKYRRDLVNRLPARRTTAVQALGRSGRADIVPDLEQLTKDRYVGVAEEAAEALGLVGAGRAVGFLEQMSGQSALSTRLAKRGFRALLQAKRVEGRRVAKRMIGGPDLELRQLALDYFLDRGPGVAPLPGLQLCRVLSRAPASRCVVWARQLRKAGIACPVAAVEGNLAKRATYLTNRTPLDPATRAWLGAAARGQGPMDGLVLALVAREADPALHRAALARVQAEYRRVLEASERWLDEKAWKRIDALETPGGSGVVPPSRPAPSPAPGPRAKRNQQLSRLLSRFPDRASRDEEELMPARLGPQRVVALIHGLARIDEAEPWLVKLATTAPPAVRRAALSALGARACARPACLQALGAALRDPRRSVRKAALDALGPAHRGLVDAVIKRLRDPEPEVRAAAAAALARSHDAKAFPALLAAFRKSRETYLVEAFGVLGDRRAELPLLALLREEYSPLRAGARLAVIEALGRVGSTRSVERLLPELEHPEPAIRLTAATVLGRLGDRRALGPLRVCAQDFYRAVRDACLAAAARLQKGDPAPVRPRAPGMRTGPMAPRSTP